MTFREWVATSPRYKGTELYVRASRDPRPFPECTTDVEELRAQLVQSKANMNTIQVLENAWRSYLFHLSRCGK